jgi:hypothetical protein
MSITLFNETARKEFVDQHMAAFKVGIREGRAAREKLQAKIESMTSVSFGEDDKIALRDYLRKLSWMYRKGEIDERTTQQGLNKVVMAAAANSPDVLHYIRA